MSHRLAGQPGRLLSLADLDQVLAETFVQRVEFHEQVRSTNDRALELARANAGPHPLLVVTNQQTGGRGRGTNRWWATAGSLAFSLLLDTELAQIPTRRWPQVSLNAGLAVCEAIEDISEHAAPRLKWPNDVYLNDRKVCGVLVEVTSEARRMLVVGVGLNVNNTSTTAPPELDGSAIAICDVAGQFLSLTTVLTRVLVRLSERFSWIGSRDDELRRRWRERCLLTGRHIRLELGARCAEGVCHGIDDQGALMVQTETGIERCFGGVVTHF